MLIWRREEFSPQLTVSSKVRQSRRRVGRKDKGRIKHVMTPNSRSKGVKHKTTPHSRSRRVQGTLAS